MVWRRKKALWAVIVVGLVGFIFSQPYLVLAAYYPTYDNSYVPYLRELERGVFDSGEMQEWGDRVTVLPKTVIDQNGDITQEFVVRVKYAGNVWGYYYQWYITAPERQFRNLGWSPNVRRTGYGYELTMSHRLRKDDDFFPGMSVSSVIKYSASDTLAARKYNVAITLPYQLRQAIKNFPGLTVDWTVKAPFEITEGNADIRNGRTAT